jgi:ABC-type uncharacterized transport system ATPase subunit
MLGAEPHWQLERRAAPGARRLEPLMADIRPEGDLDAPVADLPVGERQRLEILKRCTAARTS